VVRIDDARRRRAELAPVEVVIVQVAARRVGEGGLHRRVADRRRRDLRRCLRPFGRAQRRALAIAIRGQGDAIGMDHARGSREPADEMLHRPVVRDVAADVGRDDERVTERLSDTGVDAQFGTLGDDGLRQPPVIPDPGRLAFVECHAARIVRTQEQDA
jgi:hypothetical protein